MYRDCTQALHRVRRECGPPGTEAHERCMRALNVSATAGDVACATAATQCLRSGESDPQYACLQSGAAHPQKVYGLPLRGGPSRVTE